MKFFFFKTSKIIHDFDHINLYIINDYPLSSNNQCTAFGNQQATDYKILNGQHWEDDKQIDLDLWPCDLKSNGKYPLTRGIHCSNFGNFKAKGWTDIEWSTFVYRPAVLTFDHKTWKWIGFIYFLGASTLSSLLESWQLSSRAVMRQWADNAWSTDQLDRLTDRCKTGFFKEGIKEQNILFNLIVLKKKIIVYCFKSIHK